MTSSVSNLSLGAGKISFAGTDLGWTRGGIVVGIEESAVELGVDQFAKVLLNEVITGKKITVKAPLAETGLLAIMETCFAGQDVVSNYWSVVGGAAINRYINAGTLTVELMATETTVEAGSTPNKFHFYKAAPDGKVTISRDWEKQEVFEVTFNIYPAAYEAGTGTGALNVFTKTTPATNWTADQWIGFVLTDSAAAQYVIQDSSTTTLTTLAGTTPATGAYTITVANKRTLGTGVGTLNTWTVSGAGWTTNEWRGYTLTANSVEYTITANDATTLTISGTPTTGAYTIGVPAGTGKPKYGYRGAV